MSYSGERNVSMLPDLVTENIPLFIEQKDQFYKEFTLHNYWLKDLNFKDEKSLFVTDQIMTRGMMNELMLAGFLIRHNPNVHKDDALNLAKWYIQESATEGVNHDIAFSQMCLETGYLKFNGTVEKNQNNYCGLGTVDDKTPGEIFETPELGIRAHIQHLKAYATTESLKMHQVDNRFNFVKRGSAPTIHDLTGKWATDPEYGEKINKLLTRLYSI